VRKKGRALPFVIGLKTLQFIAQTITLDESRAVLKALAYFAFSCQKPQFFVAKKSPEVSELLTIIEPQSEDSVRGKRGKRVNLTQLASARIANKPKMIVGVFYARVDKAFAVSLFLGLWVIFLVVAIADQTGIIQIGPSESQLGMPRHRFEVIDGHSLLAAESIVWCQTVCAPATKQRTKMWFVMCGIGERPGFRPTLDLHDEFRALRSDTDARRSSNCFSVASAER
jgi:hypothetical protein